MQCFILNGNSDHTKVEGFGTRSKIFTTQSEFLITQSKVFGEFTIL